MERSSWLQETETQFKPPQEKSLSLVATAEGSL